MLVVINTIPSFYVTVTGVPVSYQFGKNGINVLTTGGGSIGGPVTLGLLVYPIVLAAGETDTLGNLGIFLLDAGGNCVGFESLDIVPGLPGPAGDPWPTPLPGAYPPGSAGFILGNVATGVADGILDQANGVETGITMRNALRAYLAVLAGVLQTQGPISLFKNPALTKNRVTVHFAAGGQRTSVTFDFS